MSTDLMKLDRAMALLAEARTLEDVKKIVDTATAAKTYARIHKLGKETVLYANEVQFRAERRLGQMLKETPRNTGARGNPGGRGAKLVLYPGGTAHSKLPDFGLTRKESSRAQFVASLPEDKFELIAQGKKTVTAIRRETKREIIAKRVILPEGKFRVFYADPPWDYGNSGLDNYGHAEAHYRTMSIPEMCTLPVEKMAEDNAVLFLWVTSPLLAECWPVIKSWGFSYRTSIVWNKNAHNFGHYISVRHEFLLICVRGSCTPDAKKLFPSVVTVKRSKIHSEKPKEFREMIEQMYCHGRKIELFARKKSPGWDCFGDQVGL